MENLSLSKNDFPGWQRTSLLIISILLVVFLFISKIGLKTNSTLEILARNSLTPEVALSNGFPTVIEFYADWCEACKEMAPDMKKIKEEINDKVNIVLLNVDNPKWGTLIEKYKVNGIPHMNYFDSNGNEQGYSIGVRSSSELMLIFSALVNGKELPESMIVENKSDLGENYFLNRSIPEDNLIDSSPRSHG